MVVSQCVHEESKGEMNSSALGISPGHIGILSLFIVQDSDPHPVGSTLAKILALVVVVAPLIRQKGKSTGSEIPPSYGKPLGKTLVHVRFPGVRRVNSGEVPIISFTIAQARDAQYLGVCLAGTPALVEIIPCQFQQPPPSPGCCCLNKGTSQKNVLPRTIHKQTQSEVTGPLGTIHCPVEIISLQVKEDAHTPKAGALGEIFPQVAVVACQVKCKGAFPMGA